MKSSNPILNDRVLEQSYAITEMPMTVTGTMNKLLLLSLIMIISATAVFYQFTLQRFDFVNMIMIASIIVGFVCAIVIAFKPDITKYLAPIYAFSQGAVLSGVSCMLESELHGIVIQAISLTLMVVLVMAVLFRTGIIKATEKFRAVIFVATLSIFLFYLISFIISFFGINIPYFSFEYTNNISIVINVAIVIIAALNLIIDFDFIDRGVRTPLPSSYEWYGAFGLLVTIVWLYIEILRLLARVNRK